MVTEKDAGLPRDGLGEDDAGGGLTKSSKPQDGNYTRQVGIEVLGCERKRGREHDRKKVIRIKAVAARKRVSNASVERGYEFASERGVQQKASERTRRRQIEGKLGQSTSGQGERPGQTFSWGLTGNEKKGFSCLGQGNVETHGPEGGKRTTCRRSRK